MYYRVGDRVRIKNGRVPNIWCGMTGRIAHIALPDRFGMFMYGIQLDEPDSGGKSKVIMVTRNPFKPHNLLDKLDSSELHPKFINYKKFKFK